MRVFVIGILLMCSPFLKAQSLSDSLSLELERIISSSEIPGLSVSIIGEKGILYSKGFGYRDKQGELSYDSLTVQSIASISKTIIAVALMKLVETGALNLEEDINTYLPFKVVNPSFPEAKITLLQLATHTSSIQETDEADDGSYYIIDKKAPKSIFPKGYYKYYKRHLKNQNLPMEEYLKQYLIPSGEKFKSNIFGNYEPGTQYSYSNIASTLVAYIIESVSKQRFEHFTKEHIFDPLEMKNTSWKIPKNENFATQYFHNGQAVPDYSLITFPSGDLQSNSYDLGKFMLEMMKGYNGQGLLLSKASYQVMFTKQLTSGENAKGIFWDINQEGNIGHGGAEIGTSCQVIFSPSLKKSFFMMINMSVYDQAHLERDYVKLLITLSNFAKRMN